MIIDQDKLIDLCHTCFLAGKKSNSDWHRYGLPEILKYLKQTDMYAPKGFNTWLRDNAEILTADFTDLLKTKTSHERTSIITKWLRAAWSKGKPVNAFFSQPSNPADIPAEIIPNILEEKN